jgi:hypothetical protein
MLVALPIEQAVGGLDDMIAGAPFVHEITSGSGALMSKD